MEWILAFNNGSLAAFINGYLPVVALLCLIMILPVIFGLVARNYEHRRTKSDVQRSILSRYFYYQVRRMSTLLPWYLPYPKLTLLAFIL